MPSNDLPVAYPRIRPLKDDEIDRALEIINQAALAYKGVIPADCWQEPYMPEAELRAEMAAGVNFWGYETEEGLVGVMGRQDLKDVTLIRHAYVDPAAQRQGVGARLLAYLLQEIPGPILVGTWAAAWWAIRFYENTASGWSPRRRNTACSTPTGPFRPARWKPRWCLGTPSGLRHRVNVG